MNEDKVEILDNSLTGRIVSIFPFGASATVFSLQKELTVTGSAVGGTLLFFVAVISLFSKGKVFYYPNKKSIERYKQWFVFKKGSSEPVSNYSEVDIFSYSGNNSGRKTKSTFSVVLRHKDGTVYNGKDIHLFSSKDYNKCFLKNKYFGGLFNLPCITRNKHA